MKKIYIITLLIIVTGCSSQKLINLDTAKKNVQAYYEDGAYEKEMIKIIDNGIEQLEDYQFNENSTAIFDVDETLLSNYEHTKELGFGFKWELWHEWMLKADAEAIPQTKRLYDWLIEKDVHIVIITGRNEDVHEATIENLHNVGITKFDTLITRSELTGKMSALIYKQRERKLLTEKGYEIIVSIGDQWSDIEGEYTGMKIKLPNYLYHIE